eukprot:CAMPEP_0171462052 /NCGR_PEP_ID=MMETSP0945-20130129/6248_1 /TAXON_ID=109269 /ORGANISM="Vaucheria litorea, Strain CCMP2940" /LENGTH=532 /DNA_ID=CAMNT_0011988509 /DNA_START=241 /DNA_END=1840 /DNA_ORIENTATION=-
MSVDDEGNRTTDAGQSSLQALGPLMEPDLCSDMTDDECSYETEQLISDIGWRTVVSHLKSSCESGRVVLSSPAVMNFNFGSIHKGESHVSTATQTANSEKMIKRWFENCSLCENPQKGSENGESACAEQILSSIEKLSDAERLDVFRSVFSSVACSSLVDSDEECLAVFDMKLMRAEETDRRAFAFKSCFLNKITALDVPTTLESQVSPKKDVSALISNCSACLGSDTAETCTEKMFKGFFSMNDRDRLATFKNGLLSKSTTLRLCDSASADCLTKYETYFKTLNDVKVKKSLRTGTIEDSIDLSLLESCAEGKLPTLITNPLILTYEKAYSHKGGIEAAENDWKNAIAQSKHNIENNSLIRSNKDGASCLYCAGLSDKNCLSYLDGLVDALDDSVLLFVMKTIFPEDAQFCMNGSKDADTLCLNTLTVNYKVLTDKDRLSSLLKVCQSGMLNKNFKALNLSNNDKLAELVVESTPFDETIGPILMFGISATLALFLGMMVSQIIRKKRSTSKHLLNNYRLGPIHEYTSLDG